MRLQEKFDIVPLKSSGCTLCEDHELTKHVRVFRRRCATVRGPAAVRVRVHPRGVHHVHGAHSHGAAHGRPDREDLALADGAGRVAQPGNIHGVVGRTQELLRWVVTRCCWKC